jgi:predicted nucleic acid-binding protein
VLPRGRRREALEMAALAMFREDFAGRILPFDIDAAVIYGELFAQRRSAGLPAAIADLMIASTARAWRRCCHARYGRFRGLRLGADQSMVGLMTRLIPDRKANARERDRYGAD